MRNISIGHVLVFLFEVLAGAICGGIAAAFLVPFCISARGYFAVGSEWCIIIFVAYAGYSALNNFFFSERR